MRMFMVSALLGLLSGCASIVSKSQYPVTFGSNPPGADIEITNRNGEIVYSGKSPTMITLHSGAGFFRGQRYVVRATLGGRTGTGTLTPSLDGWYFGNILLGGVIGMLIVDPLTGAMYRLPERFNVSLGAEGADAGGPNLRIMSIADISEDLRSSLIPID